MLAKYELLNDTSLADNEAFKLYLEQGLNKTSPNVYNAAQGRIIKEKKKSNTNSHNLIKCRK